MKKIEIELFSLNKQKVVEAVECYMEFLGDKKEVFHWRIAFYGKKEDDVKGWIESEVYEDFYFEKCKVARIVKSYNYWGEDEAPIWVIWIEVSGAEDIAIKFKTETEANKILKVLLDWQFAEYLNNNKN